MPLYISTDSRGEPLTPGELREGAVRALSGPVSVSAVDAAASHAGPPRAASRAAQPGGAASVPDDAEPGVRSADGPRADDPRGCDGVLPGGWRRWEGVWERGEAVRRSGDHRADDGTCDEAVRVPCGDSGGPVESVGAVCGRAGGGVRHAGVFRGYGALGERRCASTMSRFAA